MYIFVKLNSYGTHNTCGVYHGYRNLFFFIIFFIIIKILLWYWRSTIHQFFKDLPHYGNTDAVKEEYHLDEWLEGEEQDDIEE